LLLFRLPRERASERVEVWRRLKLYGAAALHGSGYLLPWSQENLERFEWLASTIRKVGGDAAIARRCARAESLLRRVAAGRSGDAESRREATLDPARYRNRRWVTRPRPGEIEDPRGIRTHGRAELLDRAEWPQPRTDQYARSDAERRGAHRRGVERRVESLCGRAQ
jgi:hypothetical protein